jgi:hypothetical protein
MDGYGQAAIGDVIMVGEGRSDLVDGGGDHGVVRLGESRPSSNPGLWLVLGTSQRPQMISGLHQRLACHLSLPRRIVARNQRSPHPELICGRWVVLATAWNPGFDFLELPGGPDGFEEGALGEDGGEMSFVFDAPV